MEKKVVAIVPAKGTSSRIESKNLKLLDGKPLFMHSIEKLLKSKHIDEVYLDTESDYLIDLVSDLDCKILKRDPLLANNKTDGHKLFMNEVNNIEADVYIQLLGTSPFIELATIEKGIKKVIESNEYDSAILLAKDKVYKWNENGPEYDVDNIPNSVDLPDTIVETMGLYIVSREAALKTHKRIGENPYQIYASAIEKIDVNWPDEFYLANFIAAGKEKQKENYIIILSNI